MATYRTSPPGLVISGKLGGLVFRPVQTQGVLSTKRAGLRGDDRLVGLDLEAHKAASEAWTETDDETRGFWEQMATEYQTGFGFTRTTNQTGHGLFLRTARSLLAAGGPFPPTFPIYEIQGRRQGVPLLFPRPGSSEWDIRWFPGIAGRWLPEGVWLRVRASVVTRPSVKRPGRTFTRTFQVPAESIPFTELDPPATLGGFEFERERGWVRLEYMSWDRWGWFSSERRVVYPVLPSGASWFLALGPNVQGEPNALVTYDPPDISVTWTTQFGTVTESETIGPGGLVTIGDVAEWLRIDGRMTVMPSSAESETGDASSLLRIPGATVGPRGNPVVFEFPSP